MKVNDFVTVAKDIATKYKTLYVMGCFGSPMNEKNKKRYTQNNDYNKQSTRTKMINNASSDTFGFDCVCLIKGILWGWNGNVNKVYGGSGYKVNGVPDIDAGSMITEGCINISKDFNNIEVGELLGMSGHIGIYIGNGLAVECTPAWQNKVQITAVGNIGKKEGYNTRTWFNHGKCKYIDYSSNATVNPTKTIDELAFEVIKGLWGNGASRKTKLINAGYDYSKVQVRVNELLSEDESVYYIVKKGDNLSSIAKKYNTTWQRIYEMNKSIIGNNPNLIQVNQKLKIR